DLSGWRTFVVPSTARVKVHSLPAIFLTVINSFSIRTQKPGSDGNPSVDASLTVSNDFPRESANWAFGKSTVRGPASGRQRPSATTLTSRVPLELSGASIISPERA